MSQKNTYYKYREPVLSFDKASINQGLIPHGRYCGFDSGSFAIDGSTYTLTLSHSNNAPYWVNKASAASTRVGMIVSPQGQVFQTDLEIEVEGIPGNNSSFDYYYTILMTLQYEEVEGGDNYPTFRVSSNYNTSPVSNPADIQKYETVIGYVIVISNATLDITTCSWIPSAISSLGGNHNVFNKVMLNGKEGYAPSRGKVNYFEDVINSQSVIDLLVPPGDSEDTDIVNRPVLEISDTLSNIISLVDYFDSGNNEITDIDITSRFSYSNQVNDESIRLVLINNTGINIYLGYGDFTSSTGTSKKSIITENGNLGFTLAPHEACTLHRVNITFDDDSTGVYWIVEEDLTNIRIEDLELEVYNNSYYRTREIYDGIKYVTSTNNIIIPSSGNGVIIPVSFATYNTIEYLKTTIGTDMPDGMEVYLVVLVAGMKMKTYSTPNDSYQIYNKKGLTYELNQSDIIKLIWNPTGTGVNAFWAIESVTSPMRSSKITLTEDGDGETYDLSPGVTNISNKSYFLVEYDRRLFIQLECTFENSGGEWSSGGIMFTLPTHYRPDSEIYHPCSIYNGPTLINGLITINAVGQVTLNSANIPSTSDFNLFASLYIPLS